MNSIPLSGDQQLLCIHKQMAHHPYARLYADATHCTSSSDTSRSLAIEGTIRVTAVLVVACEKVRQ
jgi:hypothetical protein